VLRERHSSPTVNQAKEKQMRKIIEYSSASVAAFSARKRRRVRLDVARRVVPVIRERLVARGV
jgi:hypothetical protein